MGKMLEEFTSYQLTTKKVKQNATKLLEEIKQLESSLEKATANKQQRDAERALLNQDLNKIKFLADKVNKAEKTLKQANIILEEVQDRHTLLDEKVKELKNAKEKQECEALAEHKKEKDEIAALFTADSIDNTKIKEKIEFLKSKLDSAKINYAAAHLALKSEEEAPNKTELDDEGRLIKIALAKVGFKEAQCHLASCEEQVCQFLDILSSDDSFKNKAITPDVVASIISEFQGASAGNSKVKTAIDNLNKLYSQCTLDPSAHDTSVVPRDKGKKKLEPLPLQKPPEPLQIVAPLIPIQPAESEAHFIPLHGFFQSLHGIAALGNVLGLGINFKLHTAAA